MTRSYSTFIVWLSAVIISSTMMFHTNDHVRGQEQKLRSLNMQIMAEQESLHVLKAEWVYLANPSRIAAAAQHHLGLQATDTKRVTAMHDIAVLLPVHNGIEPVQPSVQVASPVPTITEVSDAHVAPAPVTASKHDRVANLNGGHINDHMIMQHTAAAASTDKIGALIGTLGLTQ